MHRFAAIITVSVASLAARAKRANDRGDVPGWVLITVMTAALVTALLAVARPQLTTILRNALGSVRG